MTRQLQSWVVAVAAIALVMAKRARAQAGNNADPVTEGIDRPMTDNVLRDFGLAIADAEGFFIPGSLPDRAHNPGDLKIPGWTGASLGTGISVFANDGEGWDRLHRQLMLMASGSSSVYSLDMTLADVGLVWSGGDPAWSANVVAYLQSKGYALDESSTLGDVFA